MALTAPHLSHIHLLILTRDHTHRLLNMWRCVHHTLLNMCKPSHVSHIYCTFPQINKHSKDTLVQNGRPSENTQTYSCLENGKCCTQTILVSLAQWDGVLTATVFTPVWTTLPTHMCVQMTMCVSPFYAAGVAFDTMANVRSWEWPVI